jgi:glutamine amidotransferase
MGANIVVVDYGMGNVRSVEKALAHCGVEVAVTSDPDRVRAASHIVLPGVGAFGDAMAELRRRALVEPVRDVIAADTPFLGICLGLQVLFESSEESPGVEGLGIIEGQVRRFRTHLKVPHMGWNRIAIRRPNALLALPHGRASASVAGGRASASVDDEPFVYFVHSYYVDPRDEQWTATTTQYDGEFVSAVARGRCFGTQFHPEKSQAVGQEILRNFIALQ